MCRYCAENTSTSQCPCSPGHRNSWIRGTSTQVCNLDSYLNLCTILPSVCLLLPPQPTLLLSHLFCLFHNQKRIREEHCAYGKIVESREQQKGRPQVMMCHGGH